RRDPVGGALADAPRRTGHGGRARRRRDVSVGTRARPRSRDSLPRSPFGFAFSRANLTDGLLTFFFATTLFAARETIARRESNRPWALWSAVTGVAAAGAFLTKGLIGLAFPGLIVVAWALLTRRLRPLSTLLLGPALLVFLVVALPWFFIVASRN